MAHIGESLHTPFRPTTNTGIYKMTTNKKLMFAAVAAALLPGISFAQEARTDGYLTDTAGRIVMSGTNLCWRHRDMDVPSATGPCEIKAPVAVIPAAAPIVVAAAKPAAPVAKVAQKPMPQKISFSGDALFAFDKSVLKPEGRVLLDGLVKQLSGATYDNIQATGHTDRFGSNAYNQKLSERRANAVKDYLASKDVMASRIDAQGKGETQPVTKAGDCKGAKSAKVIACLQPDRRVDIEMTGAKTVTGSL
jgi:OOP family OmpA-OmpF porin